ncbi:hypothetical protein [Streptomyces sp. NRRL S-87]|uniref:hypothetical protein n=1 Tax=Streptomyces sp. NRRL S-87 TaxID=1463920 RepID=UPI0004C283A3|nr:hypothetical protein [Streptomyces sp. NRRL S-87]
MAIADDLRKTLADPTPLYFAAGTADIAVEQARKVPGLIEQLRAEAPARIEAVRNTDPKVVQDRAKEAQAAVTAKVAEVVGTFDADLKKLGEQAQDIALRSLGLAAEYAVRAKETYEKVAERGEQAVRTWRGEVAEEIVDIAAVVEAPAEQEAAAGDQDETGSEEKPKAARRTAAPRKPAAKKSAAGSAGSPESAE